MSNNITIQSPNGAKIGELVLQNYYQPTWSPSKADFFLVYYNLDLQGEKKTNNRYFTNKYVINESYLALQEFVVKASEKDLDNQNTQLVVIDLEHKQQSIISRIEHGYVTPVEFTSSAILYTKSKVGQGSMRSHFEATLTDIQNWEPIGLTHK
ncbi:hypothetical protein [uncultured Microscilla sp.]|uniref:hypothetical protein n=1 Tax=uncultured Microscilla sp. TaxID=432653 RepID=UPI00262E36AD|nr:hypothetical protein [uncultured Microscilla sp.]